MNFARIAGASPFATLRRNNAAVKAKAEDDKKDDDDEKKSKAEDDKKDDEDEKKSKAEDDKKDDEDEKKSKAEDDKKDDEDEKKSKKSKSDDGDGDDPEARIRASERARIRAIAESEAGRANPDAAYELAIGTDMPAATAIALLRSIGPKSQPSSRESLRERMAETPQPDIGAGDANAAPAPGDRKALAAAIVQAGKKRRGETD
jgi:hypothetical protein